jgi:hypothetical protein
MKSEAAMIYDLYNFIRDNGKVSSVAKSAWGQDRSTLGKLNAFLEDDGSTRGVSSDSVCVRDTIGNIYYTKGTIDDLKALNAAVFDKED